MPHSQIHSQEARSQEANSPDSPQGSHSAASPAQRRLGPRPLPQHLMLALALWGNSAAAWPSLKAAWQSSKGEGQPSPLANALQSLAPELQKADEAALVDALTLEGHRRLGHFIDGVLSYRRHPSARPASDRPVIWREGTTLLRDYRRGGDVTAPRVLVVPSLVNRYYILDLEPESSFLADLARRGYAPFVVDWDAPGPEEQGFDLTRYIAGRLEGALDAVRREPGGPIIVVGYCMGGNLALALALRRQADIAALACLATPWDFHADGQTQAQLIGAIGRSMDPLFQALGEMPVDVLQSFFASLDPLSILAKFRRFADMASRPGAQVRGAGRLAERRRRTGGAGGARVPDAMVRREHAGPRQMADRGRAGAAGGVAAARPGDGARRRSDRSTEERPGLGAAPAPLRDHDARRRAYRHDGGWLRARQGVGPARCLAPANCRKLEQAPAQACA